MKYSCTLDFKRERKWIGRVSRGVGGKWRGAQGGATVKEGEK